MNRLIDAEQKNNESLSAFLDNLEESFFSFDAVKDKITYVNKACVKVYGYPPEEFLQDPRFWFKVIHPDDKAMVAAEEPLLGKGDILKLQYRIIHPDGTIKWVLNKAIPTLDKNGNLIRIDGYTIDINEQKKAELKLEKYTMLMYQISHDLRGPLNSAKNYLSIALGKVEGEPAHTYLLKINESYNKLEGHILSLLDLGRLNRTETIIEKIEMVPFIRNILGNMDGFKGFEGIKFTTEIKGITDLYSDRQYLQSIVFNLVSNAIKFRKNIPDSIVHVSVCSVKEGVEIKVTDNGKGIPVEKQAEVFKMFSKCSNHGTGNGLGLYIVKSMVKKLQGTITMESEEGKGTTFTIYLPGLPLPLPLS